MMTGKSESNAIEYMGIGKLGSIREVYIFSNLSKSPNCVYIYREMLLTVDDIVD